MKKFMPIFLLILLSTISCGSDDSEKNTDQQSESQTQNFPVLFPDEDESEEESDDDSETILTSEPSDSCKDNSDDCDTTTWCVATSAYSGMTCYPAMVKE